MTVSEFKSEFNRLQTIYPNGSWSALFNAVDTIRENGLNYSHLNEEQEIDFWRMATEFDTAREAEEGWG